MASDQKRVVIVGAGIVGVSTAIWLQRDGHKVIIVDRKGPAAGASHGNGGVLAAIAVVPVAVPGLWKKAPGMLLDRTQPLFIRWGYLPKLIPFLVRFMGNATDKKVASISTALETLLHDTASQHRDLARGTAAEKYITDGDYVFGYKDKAAFEADSYAWNIRKKLGYDYEEMSAARFSEYDPAMAGKFGYGVRCPNHGHITDPGAYVKALAEEVIKNGGELKIAEVHDVTLADGKANGIVTSQGTIEADEVVIATGAWSVPLAAKLGLKVPLEAERGYHLEFVNPSTQPKSPTMVASGKFVMTPMEGRLRCAGIVEFGGLDDVRSAAPIDLLKKQVKELLPEMTHDGIVEWMGPRPSPADSLPLIGPTHKVKNAWMAFGHHHVGLSAGPKTGRWVAALISGQKPNIDLSPYDPARYEA